jgi:hypothetical protein
MRSNVMKIDLEEDDALVSPIDSSDVEAPSKSEPDPGPTYDEIAAEAYARYLARGRADGGDVTDWLEAEQALLEERRRARGD